jgi:seryl-tRNA synthetase
MKTPNVQTLLKKLTKLEEERNMLSDQISIIMHDWKNERIKHNFEIEQLKENLKQLKKQVKA